MHSFSPSHSNHIFDWNGKIPCFIQIHQNFPRPRIRDIPTAVRQASENLGDLGSHVKGKRIAITAGSRGISENVLVLASLIEILRDQGATPFVVPAMGSHGGATAEGQVALLAELGITETCLNAPILSSMETVEIGCLPNGIPIYMDKNAASADGIVIVNRVKPHTDFSGPIESGLAKMAVIGLGKLRGADTIHRFGVQGLRDYVPDAARLICQQAPILFGLATVENAYHEIARIEAVPSQSIAGEPERELLKLAYQLMPRIPFPEVDVLIVDEMGKNISGVGIDPKVIGRVKVHGVSDMTSPTIHTVAVLRLTCESHGNAAGIGLADVTTQALVNSIDFDTTYLNIITSGITGIQRAAIPLVAPTEKAAIETALRVCGRPDIQNARVVRIKNTLSLDVIQCSTGLLPEIKADNSLSIEGQSFQLNFDNHGNLEG